MPPKGVNYCRFCATAREVHRGSSLTRHQHVCTRQILAWTARGVGLATVLLPPPTAVSSSQTSVYRVCLPRPLFSYRTHVFEQKGDEEKGQGCTSASATRG